MRTHPTALLLAAALGLAACGGTATPAVDDEPVASATAQPPSGLPDWVVSVDSAYADPELLEFCEDVESMLDDSEAGEPTRAAAVEAFLRQTTILASAGVVVTDSTITFDGVEVGTVRVVDRPLGGFTVESAEWCYPGAIDR